MQFLQLVTLKLLFFNKRWSQYDARRESFPEDQYEIAKHAMLQVSEDQYVLKLIMMIQFFSDVIPVNGGSQTHLIAIAFTPFRHLALS